MLESFSQSLTRRDNNGNNILHVCAQLNRVECMKLVLRVQPEAVRHENAQGQTPLDIAETHGHSLCVELVSVPHSIPQSGSRFVIVGVCSRR